MMRLGTMTNLFYDYLPGVNGYTESMRRTAAAGFKVIDLNMCSMQRGESLLCDDGAWERCTDEIGEEAARLGLEIVQSHPPYPKAATRRKTPFDEGCEQNEFFRKMFLRSIEVNCRLGIPWAVLHPVCDPSDGECDFDRDIAYNLSIYGPVLEKAQARGVGFAFENMADVDGRRRFGTTPHELFSILAAFGDARTGICWDTGHGNRAFSDQIPALRRVCSRLVCTHIDDNIGQTDLHQLPYMGTVKWEQVIAVLREGNYDGGFIYELSMMRRLPRALRESAVRYALDIGNYLMSL